MKKEKKAGVCIKTFKEKLSNNQCPFCSKKLEYYHGMLGYEALRCYTCRFETDHNGLHFMEEK